MKRKQKLSKNDQGSKSTANTPADFSRRPESFGSEIQLFMQKVESLARATDMTMKTMGEAMEKAAKSFKEFMDNKGIRTVEKDGTVSYHIKPEDLTSFKRHNKEVLSCALSLRNVPRTFLCSLVHHYDAYLGRLLHVAFFVKPELLNASKRQLTYTELVALSSVDAAREYVIEKEVEAVIRDSHDAQFDWMESHFGLSLRKDLPAWQIFIEVTERRNLFVHCDGVVSSQYLAVCGEHKVLLPNGLKPGVELDVSPEYFSQAVECFLELGAKLGHVLWRKLQPDKLQEADKALHLTAYDVLVEERYSLAKILLLFAADTLKKQSLEEYRCLNFINLAIAHSFSGERRQALEILKNYDWSASEDKFKLAVAVLEHRHADAVRLMKAIGSHGTVTRMDYSSWPLFKDFRRLPEFLKAYRELFGEDFVLPKNDSEGSKKESKTGKRIKAGNKIRTARPRTLKIH